MRCWRLRRRISIPAAVGVSSEMMALAQPNQLPVPGGALRMVQSWTWVNEAAPAMPAMISRIRTWRMASARSGAGHGGSPPQRCWAPWRVMPSRRAMSAQE